jgi:H+-transporting ATPase
MALDKFWAPVPWMLEAAILVELALGKYVEAGIIALLLVFNAALGLFQESRAQATLAALKSRLALTASVQRDGAWEDRSRNRGGSWRCCEAVARRRRCGGREAHGR